MPLMSEVKKTGKRGEKVGTFLSWTLAVLACLWVAWCCAIGPLYWFGGGLSDFGWRSLSQYVFRLSSRWSDSDTVVACFRDISYVGMKDYATRSRERQPLCSALCCDTCMTLRTVVRGVPFMR